MKQYNYSGAPLLDYKHSGHIEDWQGWSIIAESLQDFVDTLQVEWEEDPVIGSGWEIYSDNMFNLYIAGLPGRIRTNVEEILNSICEDELSSNGEFYDVIVEYWDVRWLTNNLYELVVVFDVHTNRCPLTAKRVDGYTGC